MTKDTQTPTGAHDVQPGIPGVIQQIARQDCNTLVVSGYAPQTDAYGMASFSLTLQLRGGATHAPCGNVYPATRAGVTVAARSDPNTSLSLTIWQHSHLPTAYTQDN